MEGSRKTLHTESAKQGSQMLKQKAWDLSWSTPGPLYKSFSYQFIVSVRLLTLGSDVFLTLLPILGTLLLLLDYLIVLSIPYMRDLLIVFYLVWLLSLGSCFIMNGNGGRKYLGERVNGGNWEQWKVGHCAWDAVYERYIYYQSKRKAKCWLQSYRYFKKYSLE